MLSFLNRSILTVICTSLSIVLVAGTALSQGKRPTRVIDTKPKVGACVLTLADSPRLRGFYLNQSERDIASLLPSFHKAYEIEKDELLPSRELISDFREVRSDKLDDDLTAIEEYRDVSFIWQLLSGRLVSLSVTYEDYEPMNMNDFLEAVTSTTALPLKSFHVVDPHTAVINCDGFSVMLKEGSFTKAKWSPNRSQLILTDTVASAAMDAEEKEIKKQRAKDEAAKKAEEEKRKRTFKP